MTRTPIIAPRAELQILSEQLWWIENRPKAPALLDEELDTAMDLVTTNPEAGTTVHNSRFPGLRRVLLRKTRRHLYYVHDVVLEEIHIVAFWHAGSGSPPPL